MRALYEGTKIERQRQAVRAYRLADPLRNKRQRRNSKLKSAFGISILEYEELLKLQNNVCAICKNTERVWDSRAGELRRLAVDHCHMTYKVRGLLCTNCNQGLGKFKDDINLLQKALEYLTCGH